jgi:hypothetical protein
MLDIAYAPNGNSELLTRWAARYLPDLSATPFYVRKVVASRLAKAISVESRQEMAKFIESHLVADCAFAGIEAQKMCLKSGEGLQLEEARQIGHHIAGLYRQLLDAYVEDFVFSPLLGKLDEIDSDEGRMAAAAEILPKLNKLSVAIEPGLKQLQNIYIASENHRAIGFLTTQMHLTRQNVLGRLDSYGKMWLSSYFRLVEEQTCMPWRRICNAAGRTGLNPKALALVTQMLPHGQTIADKVYQRSVLDFPHHISRQGRIQTLGVQTSSTRDMNMFQAYLWLCVLEGSMSPVTGELLPLCLLVFPSVDVKWEFVTQGVLWLIQEIQLHLDAEQNRMLAPFAQRLYQLFLQTNPATNAKAANTEAIGAHLKARAVRQQAVP